MSFVDRLLQRRKIVTKVLLFVVPLVLLIAGVGMAGFYTAETLNGHMTVTRATIENIGDFEDLQSSLQAFTEAPSDQTVATLRSSISRQADGVGRLQGLLQTEGDRNRIAVVRELAAKLSADTDGLWAIEQMRKRNVEEINQILKGVRDASNGVDKQVEIIQKQFDGKEKFAKRQLFEAYAYRSVARRLENLRNAVRASETDEATVKGAELYGHTLKKEFAIVAPMLSSNGKAAMAPIEQSADQLLAVIASDKPVADKAQALRIATSAFMRPQGELAAEVTKKSGDAAERFVDLEGEVEVLKSVLDQIDQSLQISNAMQLHAERFMTVPTDEARSHIIADIVALRATSAKVSELNSRNAATRDFGPTLATLLSALEKSTATTIVNAGEWTAARTKATETLTAGMAGLKNFVAQAQEVGKADSERSATVSVIAMVAGTLLAIAGGLMLVETLRGPLRRVTEIMKRLADGDLDVKIEGRERGDEIGDMVRSVSVFRDSALENIRLEKEATSARELSSAESDRRTSERARIAAEQRQALTALSSVLGQLAEGDLEQTMDENLPEDFIEMARTYNRAVEELRGTLADVRSTADEIEGGTGNLAASADDLARRTEQQAAALEQSSRALRHLGDIVRATAQSARETSTSVNETEAFAVRSGEVVARAVGAMGEISRSSEKIATIIGVIDEIAFQTNLLALNAGVEAARAGEAGRGFAVVAQEVRELAQRCAGAAREIKGLISASSAQVTNGVHLVEETGGALSQIIAHVTDVRKLVTQISDAAEEQSTGISQVTRAVQEVEHITQRNAAMVEENNAEIHGLRQRVGVLSEKIERFKTREPHAQFGMGSYDRRDQQRRDVA
ncbi:methyl-accepting chemotaxis protein [Rhizobium soli]|uniref:Methyl-accepting chemotaxis protein n=1 Tax=Rhizobium soli TaxID=424798 RepID=A0A7X0JHN3_9HYPH|nr:methyl-accepting chemotaxis protein [Rhizobium soli]MBB6506816.1 methyl-accepting chemotaxis protein [Rhizobium soli]